MTHIRLVWLSGVAAVAVTGVTALAQPVTSAQDAVRKALIAWMDDFNHRRIDRVCDLFAKELRYDYRGLPERGYQDMCDGLRHSLGSSDRHYNYTLDIKDIMVSGDLAVAEVVWTLKVTFADSSAPKVSKEISMEVFHQQADGWKIVRFVAYEPS